MSEFRERDPRLLRAAIICVVLAAICFYASGSVHCQEPAPIFKAAVGTYMGFAVIDAGQTGSCLSSGRCIERNPLLRPLAGRPSALVATKLASNSGVAYGLWKLHKRRPKLAVALAIGAASLQVAVVGVNARTARKAR